VKRFGEYKLTIAGFAAGVLTYLFVGLAPADNIPYLLGIAVMAAFTNGVLRPVITARITKAVGRHEQGVALGISGSLSSAAMAFAPPSGGAMLDHHWTLGWALIPAVVATIGLLAAMASGAGQAPVSSPP
jgi:predicted MFS family arabinose efflux permease